MTSTDLDKFFDGDFDEEKVLAEIAENPGVETRFSRDFFAAKFEDGTRVGVPLRLTREIYSDITEKYEDPFDQIEALLIALGLEDELEKIPNDVTIQGVFVERYFDALTKKQNASLGK
ncbi:hypothetical protein [Gulosibacter molinativorax]|uniref:Uncharacterized protein n=1 Tax=Gulosibacter molinativorax TaxID=256821 RepID=A0ABT7CC65_9MICO|nr:hypothetical protein [Gulosibacter molinativorax]MDJ1372760.1 hypothetical protein [Gulosibacter molinativorax]QUY63353.1 Hypotetical protein [Gulosibacter molinativorax]